jgi:hypothetical protein
MANGRGEGAGAAWLIVAALGMADPVAAQDTLPQIRVGAYIQGQFHTTSVSVDTDGGPAAETSFEMRRARLRIQVDLGNGITGHLEPDFAQGQTRLRYAYADFEFGNHTLRAGQFKRPFSLLNLTSSSLFPLMERSVRIDGLDRAYGNANTSHPRLGSNILFGEEQRLLELLGYNNYDVGASLRGRLGSFGYEAGVFNGSGATALDDTNGKTVAARVTYAFQLPSPLTLGAAVTKHERPVSDSVADGTAFEIDAQLGAPARPGFGLLAEFATGDNLVEDATFSAVQALAWYHWPLEGRVTGAEAVFRFSTGDPSSERTDDRGMLLTPGLNLYFSGRTRFMLNWDVFRSSSEDVDTHHAFRAQAQLYF